MTLSTVQTHTNASNKTLENTYTTTFWCLSIFLEDIVTLARMRQDGAK
jgi:hypothetical protein